MHQIVYIIKNSATKYLSFLTTIVSLWCWLLDLKLDSFFRCFNDCLSNHGTLYMWNWTQGQLAVLGFSDCWSDWLLQLTVVHSLTCSVDPEGLGQISGDLPTGMSWNMTYMLMFRPAEKVLLTLVAPKRPLKAVVKMIKDWILYLSIKNTSIKSITHQ